MAAKLALILRVLLGGIFLYAAYTKLKQPWLVFALSIDSYGLLPSWAVFTVARTLPAVELILGLLLVVGWRLAYVAGVAALLMLVFNGAMLRAYLIGSAIDCGCFGVGEAVSPLTLARDGSLFAVAALLSYLAMRRTPVTAA